MLECNQEVSVDETLSNQNGQLPEQSGSSTKQNGPEQSSPQQSCDAKLKQIPWSEFHDLLNQKNAWSEGWAFLNKYGFGLLFGHKDGFISAQRRHRETSLLPQDALPNVLNQQMKFRIMYLQAWHLHEFGMDFGWFGRKAMTQNIDKVILDCLQCHGVRCAFRDFQITVFLLFVLYKQEGLYWFLTHCAPSKFTRGIRVDEREVLQLVHLGLQYFGYLPKITSFCSATWNCEKTDDCCCTNLLQVNEYEEVLAACEKQSANRECLEQLIVDGKAGDLHEVDRALQTLVRTDGKDRM